MPTPAGKRNFRITVQPWTGTTANGVTAKSWGSGVGRWAMVQAITGGELDAGNRIVMEATHKFTVPRPTTVGHRDRISWAGQVWDIVEIDQTDPAEITILAKTGQRAGN